MNRNKTSFWLCLLGGWLGLHKFYSKDIGKGILYLFTAGLFFIGWITDSITLYRVAFRMSPEEIEEREKKLEEQKKAREEQRQQALEEYKAKQKAEQDRIMQLKQEHIPYCPRCHSTSITYVEHRKGLSIGRAVVGGVIAGGAGAVLGGLTSKKVKGQVKCLNCGYTWKI